MTEPADPPTSGDDQDAPIAFLTSNEAPLDKLFASIRRRIADDEGGAENTYSETLFAFVIYAARERLPEPQYQQVLFGIARNIVANYWRDRAKHDREVLTAPSDMGLLTSALTDPYTAADHRMDVERALWRMTDRQRQALVLVYIDKFTCAEAGAAMGISASGVKNLIAKARNKLAKHYLLNGHGAPSITPRRTTRTGTSEAQT